jgi:hypothetical protein
MGWIIKMDGLKDPQGNFTETFVISVSEGGKLKAGLIKDVAKIYVSKKVADQKASIINKIPHAYVNAEVIEA